MCRSLNSASAALGGTLFGTVGWISTQNQVQTLTRCLNLSTCQALSSHVHPSVGTYATKLLEGQPYQAWGALGLRDVEGVGFRVEVLG